VKREQATREYLGISKNDSLVAAVDAYEWVESHPEEAPFVLRAALFDLHTASVQQNRELVSKAFQSYVQDRTQQVREVIKKAAISKAANGGDIHDLVVLDEAIQLISKAENNSYRWKEDLHPRGEGGRFRTTSHKVKTDEKVPNLKDKDAGKRGIPNSGLSNNKKSEFQQAYLQVSEILRSNTPNDALIYGVYSAKSGKKGDGEGEERTPLMTVGEARTAQADSINSANGLVNSIMYQDGKKLHSVQVIESPTGAADNPTDLGYDLFGPAGAAALSSINGGALGTYTDEAGQPVPELGTGERFYNQVNAGSKLAQDVLGPALGPKANTALFAANFASTHAAEAEKVIGPKARKSAYRYRGVEKTPNAVLQNTINETRNQERKKAQYTGDSQQKADTIARNKVIYGTSGATEPIDPKNPQMGMKKSPAKESAVIDYFRKKLPNEELYVLNRESGNIPPSQGVIIDRKGQVVTEAMGYGDDWYLPFNLKNLSKLQGGEYVRTRAYGGLTAEDIYTGLVSGARAVTVVSHSGVYTVEFDDDFRGSKRYNDKAARMVGRYEHLLDSLASNKVHTAQRSQAREEELKQEAAREADQVDDPAGYKSALKGARERDELDPKLAEADKDKIRRETADNAASKAGYDNASDFAETKMSEIHQNSLAAMRRDPANAGAIKAGAERQISELSTTNGVIRALGAQAQADIAVERAEEEYKMSHKPLRLNAQGYKKAQEALENQFPYYFSRVSFRPWNDGSAWNDDSGYVKPSYNRPAAAQAGYWDDSINGQGKKSADQTGFQNFKVRNQVTAARASEKAKTDEGKESGTSVARRSANSGLFVDEQKQKAYYEIGKQLLDQYANGKFSATDELGGPVIRPEVEGEFNAGAGMKISLDGQSVKEIFNDPNLEKTNFKATLPLFSGVSDLNDLESALSDPNRKDDVIKAIDAALALNVFSVKQEARDDLSAAKLGKLGAPKIVDRKDRRKQLDDFFDPHNSGATWEFGGGYDRQPADKNISDSTPVISAVGDRFPGTPEDSVSEALNAAAKDYKAAKSQASMNRNFDPNTNIKSNLTGVDVDVLGRDGKPTPDFYRNVEDLFKAKQALVTFRKEQELQNEASGAKEEGPGVVNEYQTNLAFINASEDQKDDVVGLIARNAAQNMAPQSAEIESTQEYYDKQIMRHLKDNYPLVADNLHSKLPASEVNSIIREAYPDAFKNNE
jgi:hypothetical protein